MTHHKRREGSCVYYMTVDFEDAEGKGKKRGRARHDIYQKYIQLLDLHLARIYLGLIICE